jgi:GT2 family glycosyltransferase
MTVRVAAAGHASGEAGVAPTANATVVICVWTEDRWDDIVAAVDATIGQQPQPLELIVVVDHNDDLAARLRHHVARAIEPDGVGEAPGNGSAVVRVITSTGAPGLSGARDTGMAAASGDVVAFLDDDAEPRPGWLASLCAPFADPAVTMVGGRVEPRWDNGAPSWVPDEFGWVFGCSYRGLPATTSTVRNPIGASMAVRLETANAVGAFAGELGRVGADTGGCEETEFAIRVAEALPGSRVVYEPASVVDHRVSASRATVRYFVRRCLGEGRSKARLATRTGRRTALASERAYLTRTLPAGFVRRLPTPARWPQAAMLLVGVAATGFGYVTARMAEGSQVPATSAA